MAGARPGRVSGGLRLLDRFPGSQTATKSNQSRGESRQEWLGCRKLALTLENIVCFPKFSPFPLGQEELSSGAWESDQGGTG